MYFPFNCLGCGHENKAEWSQIGQRVSCRVCSRAAIVPAPMEPLEGGSHGEFAVRFACLICRRSFATKPALVGQKIRCSGCGAGVRVPAANSFPFGHESRVVLNATFWRQPRDRSGELGYGRGGAVGGSINPRQKSLARHA